MNSIIDKTYLPFTESELKPHFIVDVEGQIDYFLRSAHRYKEFLLANHNKTQGIPLTKARAPRQIEKDERFWTVTTTKRVFDDPSRVTMLTQLLTKSFGKKPPIPEFDCWNECLDGDDLRLYFEACIPSPQKYVNWLRDNLKDRQMIPYVLDAAARENERTLEGATHMDAIFLNVKNGFAWLIEAKVLSDVSYSISFDNYRNQIARNIDVILEKTVLPGSVLEQRDPEKSLFSLLTPRGFQQYPSSRLYGWLMQDYRNRPSSLQRDLPHRDQVNWSALQQRIGWVTFEDFKEVHPNACPWLP